MITPNNLCINSDSCKDEYFYHSSDAYSLVSGQCHPIFRSAGTGKLRMVEDRLMQQKAQLLLDEAASWSLLWYLYGKGNSFNHLSETLFFPFSNGNHRSALFFK